MGASSVTGVGQGSSNKIGIKELGILANAPAIILAGAATAAENMSSPPSVVNEVIFPYPLEGGMEGYVVLLTSVNAGYVYVSDRDEDEDGRYIGFSFVAESDGIVMYTVIKVGVKAP